MRREGLGPTKDEETEGLPSCTHAPAHAEGVGEVGCDGERQVHGML